MRAWFAPVLTALLFVSILLAWAPQRWAVSLLETGAFLLLAVWVAQATLRRERPQWSVVLVPLAAAPLWGLLQLAAQQTVYRHPTWNAVLLWGTLLTLFFLALQVFASAAARERFLRATLLFGFAVSVAATLQMFTSPGHVFWIFPAQTGDSPPGPFLSRNQYAAFIELVFPLALVGALKGGRGTVACVFMASAMYASVVASASRAGFILVSLEAAVFAALAIRRRLVAFPSHGRTLAWLAVFVALFTLVVGWDLLWNRLGQADPYSGRREMLYASLEMLRERPGMGFGLGTWPTVYPAYARYDDGLFANHAHNDWAEWAAEAGLPFLAFLLWIAAWSTRPALRSLWGLGVVAVFAHGLVDYPFQKPALAGLVFVFLAILALEYKESAKKA
jgi:O-antigen ligase